MNKLIQKGTDQKAILIADDDIDFVDMLEVRLQSKGYKVIKSYNGIEAIKKVYFEVPDLILLDVMMPKMNGYQVCRFIKSHPLYKFIPIIIVTVKEAVIERQKGFMRGADDYIVKPFKVHELTNKIEKYLEATRLKGGLPKELKISKGHIHSQTITDLEIIKQMNDLLDKSLYKLSVLKEINKRMTESLDLDSVFHIILNSVTAEVGLGFSRAIIFILDRKQGIIEGKAGIGIFNKSQREAEKEWGKVTSMVKNKTLIDIIENQTTFPSSDESENACNFVKKIKIQAPEGALILRDTGGGESKILLEEIIDPSIRKVVIKIFNNKDVLIIPLVSRDKAVGLLTVDTFYTDRIIDNQDINDLMIIANQAGLAIERLSLYKEEYERAEEYHKLLKFNNSILNGVNVGILFMDKDFSIISWNKAMENIFKIKRKEALGENLLSLITPFGADFLQKSVFEVFKENKSAQIGHFSIKIGKEIKILDVKISALDIKDEVSGAVMVVEDITKKVELEKKIVETDQFLSNLVRHSVDGIISIDLNGKIKTWNKGAEKIFGYQPGEVIGKNMMILNSSKSKETVADIIKQVLDKGFVLDHELKQQRKDGQIIDVELTISAIRNEEGKAIALSCIARDVSEKKKVEQQLRQTEKLASLGVMAAGVAHEINNPLASISMYAQILQMRKNRDKEENEYLMRITQDTDRIAKIVKDLLAYSNPRANEIKLVDINSVIDNAILLMAYQTSSKKIKIEKDYEIPLPKIKGDVHALEEVFINLLVNASHAMPDGGTLTIITKAIVQSYNKGLKSSDFAIHPQTEGKFIKIDITDTGMGISKSDLAKVFDPFFTTKPVGQGTGLGLSVVQRIIQNHNGHIEVKSELKKGTRFTIKLPVGV